MKKLVAYLDWNATTPPHAEVVAAMVAALEQGWANPASVHGPGRRARAHVEAAREAVAALVLLHPRDVTLTSGGTEANNLALAAPFAAGGANGALVVSRLEHPSVTRAAEALAERGVAVEWALPEASGRVTVEAISAAMDRAALRAPVRLVTLQAVNHETGIVQPVAAVAELVRARGALLHVDAVQAVGKLPASSWQGADLVSIAGHKIRGPKGIGALATRPGIKVAAVLRGGAQEKGVRPGTQDPAACAGLAVAATRALSGPDRYAALAPIRDRLESALEALGARHGLTPLRNGSGARAPHVSNMSWPGWRGEELCAALDLEGIAVSSGSACSAGTAEPSPVLLAMLGEERALGAVRISFGEDADAKVIDEVIAAWNRVLERVGGRPSTSP